MACALWQIHCGPARSFPELPRLKGCWHASLVTWQAMFLGLQWSLMVTGAHLLFDLPGIFGEE